MPTRIDTLTYTGFGLLGAGTTGELVKEAAQSLQCPLPAEKASENLMELNLFFGYFPGYELNLTGVIAITGLIMMIRAAIKGNKEKKRRIERETFPNTVVRDPNELK